ncbi:MAG TPA: DUF3261 domain-containing protein [Candidatus Limnocylindrales bacterium]|nr:DUF3261 domain-containing protein [Candidatus Limnocylindrales bacterium]
MRAQLAAHGGPHHLGAVRINPVRPVRIFDHWRCRTSAGLRGPQRWPLAAALIALSVGACGCTLVGELMQTKVRDCEGFDVPLTTLFGTSRKQLHVRVVARHVDSDFAFVTESAPESFVMIGFTPLGTKSFTLVRRGDNVDVQTLMSAAQRVPPKNVMSDVLAMSIPSACSPSQDGVFATPVGDWQVSDNCKDGRPLDRSIAKKTNAAGQKPDVEVTYQGDAIMVRQNTCKYLARYVLETAPVAAATALAEVAPAKTAAPSPAAPAASVAPAPATAPLPAAPSTPRVTNAPAAKPLPPALPPIPAPAAAQRVPAGVPPAPPAQATPAPAAAVTPAPPAAPAADSTTTPQAAPTKIIPRTTKSLGAWWQKKKTSTPGEAQPTETPPPAAASPAPASSQPAGATP